MYPPTAAAPHPAPAKGSNRDSERSPTVTQQVRSSSGVESRPQLLPHHTARVPSTNPAPLRAALTAPQGHQLLPAISSPLATCQGQRLRSDSPGDLRPIPAPQFPVTVSVKENTPLQAVPTRLCISFCLFLPLRLLSVWRVCQGGCLPWRQGTARDTAIGPGCRWEPAACLGLQTAGLGRGQGMRGGGRPVGTCLRVSRERERHLAQGRQKQHRGAQVHLRDHAMTPLS